MFAELFCPFCQGNLYAQKKNLICKKCQHHFPKVDNIAVLWDEKLEKNKTSLKRVKDEFRVISKINQVLKREIKFDDYGCEELLSRSKKTSYAAGKMEEKSLNDLRNLLHEDISSLKILNIGAGMGKEAFFLQEQGAQNLVLVDLSIDFLKIAHKKVKTRYSLIANAENLPIKDDSFDLVLFGGVLHHISHYQKAIKEAARIGKIIVAISEPSDMYELHWLIKKIGWNSEYGGLKTTRLNPVKVIKTLEKQGFEVTIKTDFIWFPFRPFKLLSNNKWFVDSYFIFLTILDKVAGHYGHNLTFVAKKHV